MLGGDRPPAIVFVTAFDQYALRAFEAGALDYLLKPFDNARFQLALSRAKKRAHQLAVTPRSRPPLDFIALKAHGRVLFLKLAEVDWIEAADYYSCLHAGPAQHLLRRSLAELEADLDPAVFCRIHRSTIVRLDRVRGLKLNESGDYDLELRDGTLLRISRSYRAELQSRLGIRL
jgi:two-component system LytT family response regulator